MSQNPKQNPPGKSLPQPGKSPPSPPSPPPPTASPPPPAASRPQPNQARNQPQTEPILPTTTLQAVEQTDLPFDAVQRERDYLRLKEKERERERQKEKQRLNSARDYRYIEIDNRRSCFESFIIILCVLICIITFPICLFFLIRIVKEYQRGIILRLGKLKEKKFLGPGVIYYLPCIDSVYICDLRTLNFDIDPQELLTKDAVTIEVDAVVYFHVNDPIKVILQVQNYFTATQLLAQTTLRNVFGTKTLGQIISEKEEIAKAMQFTLDAATNIWGIAVERVEIKDVRLPNMLQRAMAAEAEALREAKAKIVAAEGEKESAFALKEAAEILSQSPAALQLRYLQTLATISTENNSTIVFPFPLEMLKK